MSQLVIERISANLDITARHEAGHVVAAASLSLPLRAFGVMVDTDAEGIAYFCKRPRDSDPIQESVIIAVFAGFAAHRRFCESMELPAPEEIGITLSPDHREARTIEGELSTGYVANRTMSEIDELLQSRAETLVAERYSVIQAVATALLAREWEPVEPLKNLDDWSKAKLAKHLPGAEIAVVLREFGIDAEQLQDA